MSIWAHSLIRNEERYIWYALRSVVDYVDRIMVWDTGSTDRTVEIVESLRKDFPQKIFLKKFGSVTPEKYTELRQKMLDETDSDWFMVLDGDEVWWNDSIRIITDKIKSVGGRLESIVNPYINLVGDIFHIIPANKGKYLIDGRLGHQSIRFINRKIPGLYTSKPHGQHGYFDKEGSLIQDRNPDNRIYLDVNYLHFTHLQRSSNIDLDKAVPKRAQKLKYELGIPLPTDYYYPEVFFMDRPTLVPSPWRRMKNDFLIKSFFLAPLKIVKSHLSFKSGY